FQARLNVELAGWLLRGDVDLVRLERQADGSLLVLIGEMKSTVEVKVEHRLLVAFYRLRLERLVKARRAGGREHRCADFHGQLRQNGTAAIRIKPARRRLGRRMGVAVRGGDYRQANGQGLDPDCRGPVQPGGGSSASKRSDTCSSSRVASRTSGDRR